ncbi:MAG: hypothetical protein LBM41_04295 [Ruminococcus sp.]|jgi:hypothetical protein|nr:hypothetical protein [Ruminococcus sp.]
MKKINFASIRPSLVMEILVCAIINAFLFLYFLPIAAASHATNIPAIAIGIIYFAICLLITSRAKRYSELIFLSIISFLLTLLFLRLFGQFIVINRYIAIVNDPDREGRRLYLTDNLGINMNMLGFLFASALAVIFRLIFLLDKSGKLKQ